MPACSSSSLTAATSAAAGAKRAPNSSAVKYLPYSRLVGVETSVASFFKAAEFDRAKCTAMVTERSAGAAPTSFASLTQLATFPVAVAAPAPDTIAVQAMAAAISPPQINRFLDLLSTRNPLLC